jgi:molybdate transport system substrate-binding protein
MHSFSHRLIVLALLLALPVGTAACGGNPSSSTTTLNVFAAASLEEAFNEAGQGFTQAHPNVKVTFNYGGSNTLVTEIIQGAPADVFASADQTQMTNAIQGGVVAQNAAQIFAHNRLVVVTPKGDAKVAQLQDLAKPGVKVILAASAVPVGKYALTFLDNASKDPAFGANFKASVLANVVSYEQDVKTVFTKIELGEGDAGIVYTSDYASDTGAKSALTEITIPDNLNVIATYLIAPVKSSANLAIANQFVAYILSSAGQALMVKYGFIAANG